MAGEAGLGLEPETVGEVAARWSEVADLLDDTRAEVAALDPAVLDPVVRAAAVAFRDDLARRVQVAADEARVRSRVLRAFVGDVERQDEQVAHAFEGRARPW